MRFTIITLAYNLEDYIEETVRSVISQDFADYEYVIVDDGSKDKTPEILKRLAEENENIRIVTQENQGVPVARNTGLDNAEGEFIIFIDGDDLMAKGYLKAADAAIAENPDCDIYVSDYMTMNYEADGKTETSEVAVRYPNGLSDEKNIWKAAADMFRLNGNWLIMLGRNILKTETIKKNDVRFDPKFIYSEDFGFYMELVSKSKKIGVVKHASYFHRKSREGSLSSIYSRLTVLRTMQQFEIWHKKLSAINAEKHDPSISFLISDLADKFTFYMTRIDGLKSEDKKFMIAYIKDNRKILSDAKSGAAKLAVLLTRILGFRIGTKILYVVFPLFRKILKKSLQK